MLFLEEDVVIADRGLRSMQIGLVCIIAELRSA